VTLKNELKLEEVLTGVDPVKEAHYAESASVTEGYITGKPVLALCGAFFVPSRDPEKFPVCSTCKDVVDALLLASE
jgi:hypothetical protein